MYKRQVLSAKRCVLEETLIARSLMWITKRAGSVTDPWVTPQ